MATLVKTAFYPQASSYIVTKKSTPYTCRPSDRTSLVVMPDFQHAVEIARIIESHYMSSQEGPDITQDNLRINLMDTYPKLLQIESIDPDNILEFCITRNLGVCVVQGIIYSEESVKISCEIIDVDVPKYRYIDSFEDILKIDL